MTRNRFRQVTRAATTILDFAGAQRHDRTTHNFRVLLDGDITSLHAKGMRDGDQVNLVIEQDASGSHTVAFSSVWRFAGGPPTVTSTAHAASLIQGVYCAAIGKILAVASLDATPSASPSASASPSSSASSSASRSASPSSSVSPSVSPSASTSSSTSASVSRSASASSSASPSPSA